MENEIIELENEFIVLAIPKNTVEITISAKVFNNGELQTVQRAMSFDEVREAFKEAEQGYIPSDAVFSLTPLGKEYVDKLIKRQREMFEEE